MVDSLDLYEYLIHGMNPTNVRLQTGDVVFVPVHGGLVTLAGKVARPAVYELLPTETLRDALAYAGGLDPSAGTARVTIQRILPPASGTDGGREWVSFLGADQFSGAWCRRPNRAGRFDHGHAVADRRPRVVTVRGNVYVEGRSASHRA